MLLTEDELLTEELLLLVGLAEVRWCKGMASVCIIYDRLHNKKRK